MDSLQHSKLFGGMLAAELNELQRTARYLSYPAGANVFQEGDPGDGLYVIARGQVQITCLVTQDQRRVLSRLGPADFFGEMAVLDSQPRSATATAETDVELHFILREDLLELLKRSPGLAVSLMRDFSQRMREFNQQYTKELVQSERLNLVGKFARSIVHDFKNPLNIIGISAEMAAMDNATLELRQSARDRIRKQVDRLSNMINELLEFTRGSGSAVVLARNDFAAFARPLLEEMAPEVAHKGLTLRIANDPPSLQLPLDPRRLTHVFHNLIHNACDAMPERGGTITVRFHQTDTELVTEIQDTGQGIAPEIAPRLFEAFATFGKSQGTGLGLSICKKIILDHRGQITARNAPGGGALFAFTLPLNRPAPAPVPAPA
jgi:signal transduction histidine kinase